MRASGVFSHKTRVFRIRLMHQVKMGEFVRTTLVMLRDATGAFLRTVSGYAPTPRRASGVEIDNPEVYKPVLYAISTTLAFQAMANNIVTNAQIQLLNSIYRGNTAQTALTIGKLKAAGAFAEFLIGPLMGQLSDAYGRRVVMLVCSLVNCLGKLLIVINPNRLYAHWLSQVPTIAFGTAYFATMRAQMADVMSGRNIAENAFMHMAPAGLAVVCAPLLAGRMAPLRCYQVSTLMFGVCAWILYNQEETLHKDNRRPLALSSMNPFAFVRLFTQGPLLRNLTLTSGIQTCTDSRLMESCVVQCMTERLKWCPAQVNKHLSVMAISGVLGVPCGQFSVKHLGRVWHTHSSHFFKVAAYYAWANASSSAQMRLAQFILMLGQRQRDGTETFITDVAVAKGFGKGECEANKMNWRSMANIIAPILYSKSFATQGVKAPFYLAIVLTLCAEAVFSYGVTNHHVQLDAFDRASLAGKNKT